MQISSFNTRVFTSKAGERCRSYVTFYMWSPLFEGSRVTEQLAAHLIHGQMCVITSLFNLREPDKRSRVHSKCGICIWNLLLSTLNMKSKELSLSVKQAIIRLKHQRDSKNIGCGQINCLVKRKNTLVSSATTKDPEDHGKKLWWMTEVFFSW